MMRMKDIVGDDVGSGDGAPEGVEEGAALGACEWIEEARFKSKAVGDTNSSGYKYSKFRDTDKHPAWDAARGRRGRD